MVSTRLRRVLTRVDDMPIDDRKKAILAAIIKDYVETAEPVGSRAIVKKYLLNISAATVRNEMADLEEMGFLEQLHTSSGRIPSEQGFRYFVDFMMEKESLTEQELDTIRGVLAGQMPEWLKITEKIGNFLSNVTNYASFIVLPAFSLNEFKHMEILPMEPGKAVVFLISDMGIIMHRQIEVAESVTPEELNEIAGQFNRAFKNKRIGDINRKNLQELRDHLKRRRKIIERALEAVEVMLDENLDEKVLISGTLNMLNEPEFKDLDRLKRILTLFGEEGFLHSVIPPDSPSSDSEANIMIGSEIVKQDMKDLSLVYSEFQNNSLVGRVGLIGPVRMEYGKAAGAVESMKIIIEEIMRRL